MIGANEATFEEMLPKLRITQSGRFVLIVEGNLFGTYSPFGYHLPDAVRLLGTDPFLLRYIRESEDDNAVWFQLRVWANRDARPWRVSYHRSLEEAEAQQKRLTELFGNPEQSMRGEIVEVGIGKMEPIRFGSGHRVEMAA